MLTRTTPLILATLSLALAGCGGDEPVEAAAAPPTERHIFVSVVDCAEAGKFLEEDCQTAIERAIRRHDKNAASYKSVTSCESAEGVGKCERVGDKAFRPRLAAFVFDNSTPPDAQPLYLTADGSFGFRMADKTAMSDKDDNLVFSKSARDLYELHSGQKR